MPLSKIESRKRNGNYQIFEIEREISLSTLDFSLESETLVNACSCTDAFKALGIACIPFFLFDFLDNLLTIVLRKCAKEGLEKTGLLRFLGPTKAQRSLGLNTARAFSGHALQLLFQVFLDTHVLWYLQHYNVGGS